MENSPGSNTQGFVHSTESFGSVDGPGVRFIIFLQGCSMRCQFCHNPDTWQLKDSQRSRLVSSYDLLKQALRYASYWGKDGGITVSGGEPLLQIDFLIDLFSKAKAKGIHTTLDTSGQPFSFEPSFFEKFKQLMTYTDLILLDIKHIDNHCHQVLTGHSNENILAMASYLSEISKPVWIRHVLVPGINDDDTSLYALHNFIVSLNNVERIEVLPYHTLGAFKWQELGLEYPLTGVNPPSKTLVDHAKQILGAH